MRSLFVASVDVKCWGEMYILDKVLCADFQSSFLFLPVAIVIAHTSIAVSLVPFVGCLGWTSLPFDPEGFCDGHFSLLP